MRVLVGTPSDDVTEVLATGRTEVSTIFVSMSARHPGGDDLEYLEWHCYDHRPEQYRLRGLRGSLRLVSTPECRDARIVSDERYDEADHVMTYLFTEVGALREFSDLGAALHDVGRIPYLLPMVERAVYGLEGMAAAPRIKIGADVLPWWPATGVLLLIERGHAPASALAEVPGVAGAWWATGVSVEGRDSGADHSELQLTYCFLDDAPALAAQRLRPVLQARWEDHGVVPLLAAPFYVLDPSEPDRYLP
jgi:hypothetical protein